MQDNNKNILPGVTDGRFVSTEEFKNMDLSRSSKFSNVKQWSKSFKEIEEENDKYQKIIAEIKYLEKKIDKIINILETKK